MISNKLKNIPLRQDSANFVRHYLNPGDDVALPWEGVPDDCAFYSFKYGNQFSYDFNLSKIKGTWSIPSWYVYDSVNVNSDLTSMADGETGAYVGITDELIAAVTDVVFIRFPFPEMPGAVLVHWATGLRPRIIMNRPFTTDTLLDISVPDLMFPIWDPNWQVPHIKFTSHSQQFKQSEKGASYLLSGVEGKVDLGMAEQFTATRLVGASMTVENTTAPLYRDGQIYATNISCPYTLEYVDGLEHHLVPYTNDFPNSAETLTSFQPYHTFKPSEGAYVVLRHAGDSFDYKNVLQYHTYNNVSLVGNDMQAWTTMVTDRMTHGFEQYQIGASGLINITNEERTHIYMCLPHADNIEPPLLSTIEPSNWTTGLVCPVCDWAHATFKLKFNTYVEALVGSQSMFKTSITRSPPYDGEAFRIIRDFYAAYDGIYPASWNSSGKLNAVINRLKSFGKVGYMFIPNPTPSQKVVKARNKVFDELRKIYTSHNVNGNPLTPEQIQFITDAVKAGHIRSWKAYVDTHIQNAPKKRPKRNAGGRNRGGGGRLGNRAPQGQQPKA